jgi:hypothetical protein
MDMGTFSSLDWNCFGVINFGGNLFRSHPQIKMDALTIFIKFLQACITPVAMISGVGLLLLTVTNRMGRTIDRARQLIGELDKPDVKRQNEKKMEILVFMDRCKLLRNSIAWVMIGMMSSCSLIPLLFLMSFTTLDLRILGYGFFLISISSMLIAFVYFFKDVLLSLKAIKLEARDYI